MFIIRNALLSISRSKGRNILIGIIVFAIAAAGSVALAIRSAAADERETGLSGVTVTAAIARNDQKIRGSVTSGGTPGAAADFSAMQELQEKYPELTFAQYEEYATDENVANTYYSQSLSLSAGGDLTPVSDDVAQEAVPPQTAGPVIDGGTTGGGFSSGRGGFMIGGSVALGDFTVTGVSAEDAMTSFINRTSQLEEGGALPDFATDDYSCLISRDLARFNSLKIGDTLTLENPSNEAETYKLKIVGIFTNTAEAQSGMPRFSTAMDPANNIYLSAKSTEKIAAASAKSAVTVTDTNGTERSSVIAPTLSYTYSFEDKTKYEAFSAAVTAKLGEYYTVTSADADAYERSLQPMESLEKYALTFLIVMLAIGAVILVVINLFNIRERKYEVGVLTAIGVKKHKVAAQFIAELLVVTLLSVALGAGIGAVVSVPVSNKLLESQVQTLADEQTQKESSFGRGGAGGAQDGGSGPVVIGERGGIGGSSVQNFFGGASTPVKYLAQINAAVNPIVLLQLIAVGLLLTLFSSLAAVVFILRYEPLKILAERS
ncbi:MAG: ABC transporter permease [Oscillospiraceae bacterium]|jgi:putative ABC transport system permease protein|nr:ABC transporter permease [Oscillospiraceae bacterium]